MSDAEDQTPQPAGGTAGEADERAADEARWAQVSARWDEVGEHFRALGEQVRQQWQGGKEDERLAESQRSIDAALKDIADAASRVVSAIGDTVKDPGPRQEAGKAASTLADAFAGTVQAAVDEVQRFISSRRRGGDGGESPAS
ncbi:MAG: hypothetical protein IPM45_13125 [Acidimicrobiales bacterium]|nr:hypothetical protein [Acidimicrobiales bacterium]